MTGRLAIHAGDPGERATDPQPQQTLGNIDAIRAAHAAI
jgi:hypothetical protein